MPPRAASGRRPRASASSREKLRPQRPLAVHKASQAKFQEQANAGREKGYGAVGSLDYEITVKVWDAGEEDTDEPSAAKCKAVRPRRERVFGVSELMEVLRHALPEEAFAGLNILDLGCGDGRSLHSLHERYGLPWKQLVGITAEDMRGLEVLDSEAPFDLRASAGPEADASYYVWNIDDLDRCEALQGRTFDVVISWVTWCWLTDPMGALETAYERFLRPGGVLLIGSLQLSTDADPEEDQRNLLGIADYLAEQDGHRLAVLTDGPYAWWLQRKVRATPSLSLGRVLEYRGEAPVDHMQRAVYAIKSAVPEKFASVYREGTGRDLPSVKRKAELDMASLVAAWFAAPPD